MSATHHNFAQRIVDSLNCGVVAVDASGQICVLNDEARRLLFGGAASASSAIEGDYRAVLEHHPSVVRELEEALAGGEGPSRAELALSADDDGPGPGPTIGFSLHILLDDADAPCGAAMLFRDLTPFERQGEQELLRDRLAALGEMAAGMAHEIRNPLAGMEVVAGLLKRRLADAPEAMDLLAELIGELHAVERVVSASLEYVRNASIYREPCDAEVLLEGALSRAEKRLAFAGRVERSYPAQPVKLSGDRDQLLVVLTDLIENAIDAMRQDSPHEQCLRLEFRQRESEVVFGIADSGPGIPPELRARVFYPFFTTKDEGSGIGLAGAQKVLSSHGGRIILECPETGGTRFRVSLPVEGGSA